MNQTCLRAARAVATALALWTAPLARAQLNAADQLAQIDAVKIEQRLSQTLPLDLEFRDETGRAVKLGEYFGQRPVVVALVYYECPMLCTLVLNGMLRSFRALNFSAGKEFDVVTVSIDPTETPALAAAKKEEYLKKYARAGASRGWHFLTGEEATIKQLADAVGFGYVYLPERDEYAHAAAIMVATPAGKLSKYFYGIEYAPRDLRFGIIEASDEKIGSFADQLMLLCFHYDPLTGKYGMAIMRVVRVAGFATVATLVTFMLVMFRRDRRAGEMASHV